MATTEAVKERPILFSGPMVRAILAGRKTQTRRIVKPQPHEDTTEFGWGYDGGKRCPMYCPRKIEEPEGEDWRTYGHMEDALGRQIYLDDDDEECVYEDTGDPIYCPYGNHGNHLWVRETWRAYDAETSRFGGTGPFAGARVRTYANPPVEGESVIEYRADAKDGDLRTWLPSIHMRRWMSRLTLEITEVRVQRLQEITEGDACAEGAETLPNPCGYATTDHFPCCKLGDELGHPVLDKFRVLWESINGKGSWAANPWVWAISFRRLEETH